jgi:hypothetical protein
MIRAQAAFLLTAVLMLVVHTRAAALCGEPMETYGTPGLAVNHQYMWFLIESLARARIAWQEADSSADSTNPAVRLANLKLAVEDFQCAASLVQKFQTISGPDQDTGRTGVQTSARAATLAYTTFATGFQRWVTAMARGQGTLPLEAAADFKVQNEKASEILIHAMTAGWLSLLKAAPNSQTMDRLTLTRDQRAALLEGLKRRRFRPDPDLQSPDAHSPEFAAALLYRGLSNPKFKAVDEP